VVSRSPFPGPRRKACNLLLLVPFLMLVSPWFNADRPRLFGLSFFYWSQLAFVPIAVVCMAVVFRMTRNTLSVSPPTPSSSVDELDEGATR
jgi:hypothetical protein